MKKENTDQIAEAMAKAIAGAFDTTRTAEIHASKTSDGMLKVELKGSRISLMAMSVEVVKRIKNSLAEDRMMQVAYVQSVMDYCTRWLGQMAAGVTDEDDSTKEADD